MLSHTSHLYHTLPEVQGPSGKRNLKHCKSQRLGRKRVKVSYGHDRTAALMNARQLWWSAQDLHEIKAVNTRMEWKGARESPPRTKELWTVGVGEPVFSKDVVPGRSTLLQCTAPHPEVYGEQTLELMGYQTTQKKTRSWGQEKGGGARSSWGRSWGE